jgi:hypothetical protein
VSDPTHHVGDYAEAVQESNTPQSHWRTVGYIEKSRDFYAAHGYEVPYRWASYSTVPFTSWAKNGVDLENATIGLVTTAFPMSTPGPKAPYAEPASPVPETMSTDDLSWDKDATTTDDVGSFLPLDALETLSKQGVVGASSARFYGVPTRYSHRRTMADAERIVEWLREDGVDGALLTPL